MSCFSLFFLRSFREKKKKPKGKKSNSPPLFLLLNSTPTQLNSLQQATYLADRVIVYDGEPSKCATAHRPQSLLTGMNSFLKALDITFRRDPTNYRPRINKLGSTKDQEQKSAGSYYYLDED